MKKSESSKSDLASKPSQIPDDVPVACSQRWILAYVGFFGFAVVYSLRVNISVAIVCMLKTLNETSVDDAVNVSVSDTGNQSCVSDLGDAVKSNDRAELEWSSTTKSTILASFFYGYIVTQVPGGWLSDRYGGKHVLGIEVLVSSVLTLLMPVCARYNVIFVYVIRVTLGLLTAMSFPSMHAMWGKWAPPLERSKLTTLCYAGTTLGNVVTFSTSGLLCAYGFDNGWASIFYITGMLGVLWSAAWFLIVADLPSTHPRITEVEKNYITTSIEYRTDVKTTKVPWLAMAKSPCLWACLTAHVCNNWTNYTLLTNIPTFMKEVLKFDIKKNGALSSIPYLCQFFAAIFAGQSADFIRSRGLLSTTKTRKLYQTIAFSGAGACLVGTGFCGCEQRALAVALLSLAVMFTGIGRAGYVVNHVDFAPKYAGVLFGITNTAATVPGMIAPILAGVLTPNGSQEEWRNVFYVCAAIGAFGMIVFDMFASGELQDWAKDEDIVIEIDEKSEEKEISIFPNIAYGHKADVNSAEKEISIVENIVNGSASNKAADKNVDEQ